MVKELHLVLDYETFRSLEGKVGIYKTYKGTLKGLESDRIVYTVIPHFLNFRYAEELYVHHEEGVNQIKLGYDVEGNGTHRDTRRGHNIEKMLFAGEFSWYR